MSVNPQVPLERAMSTERWLDPVTGLPSAKPYAEFTPAETDPRPVVAGVWVAGALAEDANQNTLILSNLRVSGPNQKAVRPLQDSALTVRYDAQRFLSDFSALKKGSSVSLSVRVEGWLASHLRATKFGPVGIVEKIFRIVPAPPGDSK